MKLDELNEIVEKSKHGEATITDVIAIAAASLESSSRHGRETRRILGEMNQALSELACRLERLEKHVGSPIWQLAHDDSDMV
jgi:hypothetical protein